MQKYRMFVFFIVGFHVISTQSVKAGKAHIKTGVAFLKKKYTNHCLAHNLTFTYRIIEREHTLVLVDHVIACWYFYTV